MSNNIQRYTINCYQYTGYIDPLKTGNLVLFEDHKAEIKELVDMLERGLIGTGGLLIQTSDQSAVIQWRKESQELINKIRSE